MQILGYTTGAITQLAQSLRDCPVRLRWGGPQVANAINGSCHLLNGLEQLQALQATKVPTVEFTTDISKALEWLDIDLTVFGRKLNHTQGFDIRSKIGKLWRSRDYWTKYVESEREWRMHVVGGFCIARSLKEFSGITKPTGPCIRSRRLGWVMRHDIDPPKGLRTIAKAAVKAIGYDLGAVDILEIKPGEYKVLEVNSRPAIRDPYTLAAYTKALRAWGK